MENKHKVPCEKCILLPSCISIYKLGHLQATSLFRFNETTCDIVRKYLPFGLGSYIEHRKKFDSFNKWWRDNYGE